MAPPSTDGDGVRSSNWNILKSPRQLTGLAMLVVGRLSIVLAALAAARLVTTLLSPAEVGRYSVVLAFVAWFALTFTSPATNYIYRRLIDWASNGELWRELGRYTQLLVLIACGTASASFVAQRLGLLGIDISIPALLFCITGILVSSIFNLTLITSLNLLGHRGLYVVYTSATAWLGLGLSTLLTVTAARSAEAWIAGQVLGWIVVSVAACISLRRSTAPASAKRHTPPAEQQGLWAFAWPLVISTSFYWFQVQGYRIELGHWFGLSAVGLLTTGLMLGANPLVIIDTLLADYLRPAYYQAISTQDRLAQESSWTAMAAVFFPCIIPVAVLVALSGPFLATLLVGPLFQSASSAIAWGTLTETLRAVYSLYVLAAQTCLRTQATLRSSAIGAGIVVVVLVPLARWHLYTGTGLALVLGMVGCIIVLAFDLQPHFKPRLPIEQVVRAVVCTVPLVFGLIIAQVIYPHPSQLQALVILLAASVTTLGVLAYVGRIWLLRTTL